MKIKTLVRGSDGSREYEAGEVLEGDSQHARVLLFNNLAEPLDEQAQRIFDEMNEMTEEEWEASPLKSHAHWDRGDEERAAAAAPEPDPVPPSRRK